MVSLHITWAKNTRLWMPTLRRVRDDAQRAGFEFS